MAVSLSPAKPGRRKSIEQPEAYACNSQGLAAVASGCSIDFLRPGFAGDKLTATARVMHQGKLTGVYDIEIQNQQQKTVALFRGKSHRIGGTVTGEA